MLLDPKTEVARLGEVTPTELVLLHLEASLEDFLSFWPTYCDVHCNLLVTTDTELADCVAGLGRHRCLTG